jgi:hypothetical protein
VAATLVLGAVLFALLVAAAGSLFGNRAPATDSRWLMVGAFLVGNLLLVLTTSTGPALIGIALMLGGLIGLAVSTWRRRAV